MHYGRCQLLNDRCQFVFKSRKQGSTKGKERSQNFRKAHVFSFYVLLSWLLQGFPFESQIYSTITLGELIGLKKYPGHNLTRKTHQRFGAANGTFTQSLLCCIRWGLRYALSTASKQQFCTCRKQQVPDTITDHFVCRCNRVLTNTPATEPSFSCF